jgi:hypothetical protein
MPNGIKFGIVALENSGKTTLISKLENALVMSTDNKAFRGKVPHFRYSEYSGMENMTNTLADKLEAYEAKFGELPKTLVIDSVTHLANNMEKYWNDKPGVTGFAVWAGLGKDIMDLNAYLEDTILPAGINVIFTSHCQYDADTGKYKIAAPGNFGKNGSWLSVTDEAGFIEVKGNKRLIHFKTMKFPCRTLQEDLPDSILVDEFDINAHITLLSSGAEEADEWTI